jgi:hypothetical protein
VIGESELRPHFCVALSHPPCQKTIDVPGLVLFVGRAGQLYAGRSFAEALERVAGVHRDVDLCDRLTTVVGLGGRGQESLYVPVLEFGDTFGRHDVKTHAVERGAEERVDIRAEIQGEDRLAVLRDRHVLPDGRLTYLIGRELVQEPQISAEHRSP